MNKHWIKCELIWFEDCFWSRFENSYRRICRQENTHEREQWCDYNQLILKSNRRLKRKKKSHSLDFKSENCFNIKSTLIQIRVVKMIFFFKIDLNVESISFCKCDRKMIENHKFFQCCFNCWIKCFHTQERNNSYSFDFSDSNLIN